MAIVWTSHATDRQREWQRRLGITREEVEDAVANPDQVVAGDRNAVVAQVRRGDGLLRVPFVETGGHRMILTVYWTSQVARYWKERAQ